MEKWKVPTSRTQSIDSLYDFHRRNRQNNLFSFLYSLKNWPNRGQIRENFFKGSCFWISKTMNWNRFFRKLSESKVQTRVPNRKRCPKLLRNHISFHFKSWMNTHLSLIFLHFWDQCYTFFIAKSIKNIDVLWMLITATIDNHFSLNLSLFMFYIVNLIKYIILGAL